MTEDELRKLTSDLDVMATWKEDFSYRLRRAELIFQSSVGLLEEHRDKLLREGEAWKRAANAIVKRIRG